jgi:hypothetical protein
MRKHTKLLTRTVVLAAAGWFAGCNSTIDKEPNVVLEVQNVSIPPIAGTRNATTGLCVFTLTNATATFKNSPKNALAGTSPFNDIVLQNLTVDYVWDDGVGVTSALFGVGGTVPAGGTASGQFAVVNAQDLAPPPQPDPLTSREGHTASLVMTFRGVTVSGDAVWVTTGGSLTVNTCP